MMRPSLFLLRIFLLISFAFLTPKTSKAYTVLTHEALIDASWDKYIKPLLKLKFPTATDADLKQAHAYTYGGCLIADMGYFPFGSVYFTDLAHYVRSGDFVENLISESQNLNEYAFAVGALCHYMGDQYGHSLGTNRVVPIIYPRMEKKFGPVVTYEENHLAHSKVEISFDVLEIARGNYAPQAYHDFIGFQVARPVLERAFLKTYGQDINDVFGDLNLAISTYRYTVRSLFPTLTDAAWVLRKNDIKKLNPSINSHSFHYHMKRRDFNKEFGADRKHINLGARIVAFFIRVLPKVGPLEVLTFQDIGPKGEKIFIQSFDSVLMHYHAALTVLEHQNLDLENVDYDTGKPTQYGEYKLADLTYDTLIEKIDETKCKELTAPLQQNILTFFGAADTAKLAQQSPKQWKKTSAALQVIKLSTPIQMDSLKNAKGQYYKLNEIPQQTVGQ